MLVIPRAKGLEFPYGSGYPWVTSPRHYEARVTLRFTDSYIIKKCKQRTPLT